MNRIILNRMDFSRIHRCVSEARKSKIIGVNEAQKLLNELHSGEIVDPENVPDDVVTMNSIVKIRFLNSNKVIQIQIVYPDDAKIRENKISIFSPVATALIGYRVKDEIDWIVPLGLTKLKIEEIVYQPEAAGNYNL